MASQRTINRRRHAQSAREIRAELAKDGNPPASKRLQIVSQVASAYAESQEARKHSAYLDALIRAPYGLKVRKVRKIVQTIRANPEPKKPQAKSGSGWNERVLTKRYREPNHVRNGRA